MARSVYFHGVKSSEKKIATQTKWLFNFKKILYFQFWYFFQSYFVGKYQLPLIGHRLYTTNHPSVGALPLCAIFRVTAASLQVLF